MSQNPAEKIAKDYFESEKVIFHYFSEGHRVGLWKSESVLFQHLFSSTDKILDLGCGAGRIAFGLEKMGFDAVEGADYSIGMVEAARQIARGTGSSIPFREADARKLPWNEGVFDGIIFGFNGFFMIPGSQERQKALGEIRRILKTGGRLVLTGHDRELSNQKQHWSREQSAPASLSPDQRTSDFGDVIATTELGTQFIHATSREETSALLEGNGFGSVETWLRSQLGNENSRVREFSDECRFWAAVKV